MVAESQPIEELDSNTGASDAEGQYLTFMLAEEEYGIEILRVQEIKGWDRATPIPNTPEHVLGVLNLRGAVVPIIDLRKRFDLEAIAYGPTTVVIVVKMFHEDQERIVGLVVDAVADVYRLDRDDIQSTPEMGNAVNTRFIRGLATVEEHMVILLEVDQLIDFSAIAIPESTSSGTEKAPEQAAASQ